MREMSGEHRSEIRPLVAQESDGVIHVIPASGLLETSVADMLASLLAAHHAGQRADGQRWLVCAEDGQIAGNGDVPKDRVHRPGMRTGRWTRGFSVLRARERWRDFRGAAARAA